MASKLNPDPNTGAKLHGQQVVYPGPFDVFVDIDTELDYQFMLARLADMKTLPTQIKVVAVRPSKSGLPHRHVYLRSNTPLSGEARIALQASIGSDRVREFLSLMRLWQEGAGTTFYEDMDWVDPRSPSPAEGTCAYVEADAHICGDTLSTASTCYCQYHHDLINDAGVPF